MSDVHKPPLDSPVVVDGVTLHRFMDYIYTRDPLTQLPAEVLAVVNVARQAVAIDSLRKGDGSIGPANGWVKRLFATLTDMVSDVLRSEADQWEPTDVLEWGCGYQPIVSQLASSEGYWAADIDPRVLSAMRQRGVRSVDMNDLTRRIQPASIGLILGVFVAHHAVTADHVTQLAGVLHPRGVIVVNVYRRSPSEREELQRLFESGGFQLLKVDDMFQVVANHEYWFLHKPEGRYRCRFVAQSFEAIQMACAHETFGVGARGFGAAGINLELSRDHDARAPTFYPESCA